MAKFPIKTKGVQLDALARQYLWNDLKDYGHSTGHGVGHFLNVHENPPYIGKQANVGDELFEGMVVSNEPGYYKENEFGIRIESLVLTKSVKNSKGFLEFETLTMVPMHRELIDYDMLSKDQLEWLDNYHQQCWDNISPLLANDDCVTFKWLEKNCMPHRFGKRSNPFG